MTAEDLSQKATMSSNASTHVKGRAGEERAVAYLLEQGYRIVCRNYRSKRGEIDCIAQDPNGTLVFVEVKSAYGTACGNPAFWVTPAKQRVLFTMAKQYLAEHKSMNVPCRFDVVAISGNKIDHLKNVIIGG